MSVATKSAGSVVAMTSAEGLIAGDMVMACVDDADEYDLFATIVHDDEDDIAGDWGW